MHAMNVSITHTHSDSFSDILSASRRAMYACIGRVTRLGPSPVSLKIALFNAYVRPVMLYCADALPYTSTQAAALDSIQLQYVRWALGQLGKSSPSTDTLAEVGQKPVSYDVTRSRINYYLLVKSRPQTHITLAPLHEAMATNRKRTNWWLRVQQDMSNWKLDHWHTATQRDISLRTGRGGKSVVAKVTKEACWTAWYLHVSGEAPHTPDWFRTTNGGLSDELAEYSNTCVLPLHLDDHRGSRWYKSLFLAETKIAAPYTRVYMPTLMLRAFCLFRLGTVHLNVHTGRYDNTHVLSRTCQYCREVCDRHVVEDPYHVCMECPLYECMRVRTLRSLHERDFNFSSLGNLLHVCVRMLCVSNPSHVRTVGRFLCDCMAARDVYTQQPSSQWWSTTRAEYIKDCVRKAPQTCDTSLGFLREGSVRDTTLCQSLLEHTQPRPLQPTRNCRCFTQECWCGAYPLGTDLRPIVAALRAAWEATVAAQAAAAAAATTGS